jgi:hypothetical protein
MTFGKRSAGRISASFVMAALFALQITVASTNAYTLGSTVADMRQPGNSPGGTSCPQLTRFDVSTAGSINRQWSTSLSVNSRTILTSASSSAAQLSEIEAVIQQSLNVWTGVSGTLLTSAAMAPLRRTDTASACSSSDGLNSICFNQQDAAFTLGVLAFTRVVSSDVAGQQISPAAPASTFVGQILDADILLRPGDPQTSFATPAVLAANPNSYDLESILTHELGHSLGFGHSGVWGAMMFPFAPMPGQFAGVRPTAQLPDAPLIDDDRTGLRVLYPDPSDAVHTGSISGRILPLDPALLPLSPGGTTGIFPAQVVALDTATGAVASAVLGGWSCSDPGPAQFDGSFSLNRLAIGPTQSYQIYAEPLGGPVVPDNVIYNMAALCRDSASDPGWPSRFACTVPPATEPFSARIRPAS